MSEVAAKNKNRECYHLLIVEGQADVDWNLVFRNACLSDGISVSVHQANWPDIALISDQRGLLVTLRKTGKNFYADYVMCRTLVHGVAGVDARNKLYTMIHSGIKSSNSLQSILLMLEKPVMFGALKELQRKYGSEEIPLIPQHCHASANTLSVPWFEPGVCKIGHPDAGFGKIRYLDVSGFQDIRSVAAVHNDYVSVEPFINWEFDLRIQKIGKYVRVFRRVNSNWKANSIGGGGFEITHAEQRWISLIDRISDLFGGLDWCAVDMLVESGTGKEYVLEVNGSAIGLHKGDTELVDMHRMKDVVIDKMNVEFCKWSILSNHPAEQDIPIEALGFTP